MGIQRRSMVVLTVLSVAGLALSACGSRLTEKALLKVNDGSKVVVGQALEKVKGSSLATASTTTTSAPVGTTQTTAATSPSAGNPVSTAAGSTGPGSGSSAAISAPSGSLLTGANCKPATGSMVTLGNVGVYSGITGALFSGVQQTLQVWVKAVNACGGLNGHQVQVISMDDGGNPSTSLTDIQTLVQNDHAIAFVSNMVPLTVQAGLSYLQQQGIPVIGGDISDLTWWQSPILFPEGTYAAALIPASMQFLQSKKITKLASYVCTEDPACTQAGALIQQDASKYGITIVSSGTISIAQPSFSAECEEAQSAQAQAVFVGADGGSVERFGDDCAQQNYKPLYEAAGIAAIDSLASDPNLSGLYFAAQDFSWTDNSLPAEQEYHKALATYGPNIPTGAPTTDAWASAILATIAASHLSANNPTAAQFVAGLDAIKNNDLGGLAPPLTFNAGADAGQADCFFNMQVTQGQWLDPNGATPQCLPGSSVSP